MKNLYAILNIDAESSPAQIKAAYRKAVLRCHPDRGGDAEKFCQIKEAYDTLANSSKRREYNMQRRFNGFSGNTQVIVRPDINNHPVDVFDDLVDVLRRRFGMLSQEKFEVDIILNSLEANAGARVDAAIPFERICERCFGFGGTIFSDCPNCGGLGIEKSHRQVVLRVAPGARDNDRFILKDGKTEIVGRIVVR